MDNQRYTPYQLGRTFRREWGVRDGIDDELLRGYGAFSGKRIWHGDETEAIAVCNILNGGLKRAPQSLVETIVERRIKTAAIRRSRPPAKKASAFVKCDTCGANYKTTIQHTH